MAAVRTKRSIQRSIVKELLVILYFGNFFLRTVVYLLCVVLVAVEMWKSEGIMKYFFFFLVFLNTMFRNTRRKKYGFVGNSMNFSFRCKPCKTIRAQDARNKNITIREILLEIRYIKMILMT